MVSVGGMLLPGLVVTAPLEDKLLLVAGDEASVLEDVLALVEDVGFFAEVVLLSVCNEVEVFVVVVPV